MKEMQSFFLEIHQLIKIIICKIDEAFGMAPLQLINIVMKFAILDFQLAPFAVSRSSISCVCDHLH